MKVRFHAKKTMSVLNSNHIIIFAGFKWGFSYRCSARSISVISMWPLASFEQVVFFEEINFSFELGTLIFSPETIVWRKYDLIKAPCIWHPFTSFIHFCAMLMNFRQADVKEVPRCLILLMVSSKLANI